MTRDTLRAVADVAMRWNYRVWGFGEAIVLRGLLQAGDVLGNAAPFGFVHGILRSWLGRGVARRAEDHVGAGRELIELYRCTRDTQFLDAARKLAVLNASLPSGPNSERYHRGDTPGWRWQIWVDCRDVDGPFLAGWLRQPVRIATSNKLSMSCWATRARFSLRAVCCPRLRT
jgi:rhamnogalacturonyl hydrolase YesR